MRSCRWNVPDWLNQIKSGQDFVSSLFVIVASSLMIQCFFACVYDTCSFSVWIFVSCLLLATDCVFNKCIYQAWFLSFCLISLQNTWLSLFYPRSNREKKNVCYICFNYLENYKTVNYNNYRRSKLSRNGFFRHTFMDCILWSKCANRIYKTWWRNGMKKKRTHTMSNVSWSGRMKGEWE